MIKIRRNIFETNSSSEHSLSIVKKDKFLAWKSGDKNMYARQKPGYSEYKETWGNFWSYQIYWEFDILTQEELLSKNTKLLDEYAKHKIAYIKTLIKPNSPKETIDYYNEQIKYLSNVKLEDFDNFHKYLYNLYITYEEYKDALQHDDCQSPFEHINETEDVVIFGKYFHS